MYNYLDPAARGENINYWLSGKDVAGTAKPIKQGRLRSLKPVDEFFLSLCRLRQGFAELHLAHLHVYLMFHSQLLVEFLFHGLTICT